MPLQNRVDLLDNIMGQTETAQMADWRVKMSDKIDQKVISERLAARLGQGPWWQSLWTAPLKSFIKLSNARRK